MASALTTLGFLVHDRPLNCRRCGGNVRVVQRTEPHTSSVVFVGRCHGAFSRVSVSERDLARHRGDETSLLKRVFSALAFRPRSPLSLPSAKQKSSARRRASGKR